MAIDQREMTETTEQAKEPESEQSTRDDVVLDDPIAPDAPARQAPITQAELRQRALSNLLPSWTKARQWLAEVNGDLEDAKGRVKSAKASLERQEASLEHVGSCRLEPCLRCQEIAINPPRRDEPEEVYDEADEDEAPDAHLLEKGEEQLAAELEDADQEPVADADRLAEAEAVTAEADDQVERVSLEPDQRQALEEIAAKGGAERETAEVR